MSKKFRVLYNVIDDGFKLGQEAFWIDEEEFEEDMDEINIMELIREGAEDHFSQHYYPSIPNISSVVDQIKQYLQGENNELA